MNNRKKNLRIIAFGAHPDDCELMVGGTAALWAAQGHHIKFVSTTNGDVGHFTDGGGPLALRRKKEVEQCAKILGVTSQVLDIHDGELLPSLENRRAIARIIRDWQADIVLTHRPWDYHPDHRSTGLLVQDAAVLVAAPFFAQDTPPVDNPIILFFYDTFKKPVPFEPDVVVSFDSVQEKKWACINAMPSQFAEKDSWMGRYLPNVPQDDAGRKNFILEHLKNRFQNMADLFRVNLIATYGEAGQKVKYAEAFELCEYGRQPEASELQELFFGNQK